MSQHLLTLDNICLAYGIYPLLDHVKLQIVAGERVCLIGRNGAGKSSLLKIIEGSLTPDSGSIWRKPQLRLARLAQELPQNTEATIYEYVAAGIADTGRLLADYYSLTQRLSPTEADLNQLASLQQTLDANNGWQFEQDIKTVLTRLALDPEQKLQTLSGGWQRRAALAQALVSSPELLLLDEPTNHLDIEAIQWLEDQLANWNVGLIFITHDRALLKRLATRIIELDRGKLTSWPGDYQNFLRRKEEMRQAEQTFNAEFDKKLAEEERWIRQGVEARRTRNEGRVRALKALRLERSQRREVQGKASFNLNAVRQSGRLVIEATNISQTFNQHTLVKDFSLRIMRGDRIGFVGPNGVGKTTLLNVLLGKITPDKGDIIQGTQLQVAYFDQLRQALNPEKTLMENVCEGSDFIEINGKRQHIISYLGDFLFTPERAKTPVKALSGGECNRLLLARLFSRPANLLVMDEPTNDLDIETLELLEELLSTYSGTLLLVSHDREFLDNVVTSTLVFEGHANITEYIGGYQDWLQQKQNLPPEANAKIKPEKAIVKPKTKLSFKEEKELRELPHIIETLELDIQKLQEAMTNTDFYRQSPEEISAAITLCKQKEEKLQTAYARWEALELFKNK